MRALLAAKSLAAALVLTPVGGSDRSTPEFTNADMVLPVERTQMEEVSVARQLDVAAREAGRASGDAVTDGAGGVDSAPLPDSPRPSAEQICGTLETSAAANLLPIDFFTRLIWQESRFKPRSVSHAGAQGIAQFMPATAHRMGLLDPFDPIQAIAKAAELLRGLRARFGNLGLAAAAYNAGPKRIVDWLAKRAPLPPETQDYVRIITGHAAEEWTGVEASAPNVTVSSPAPCLQLAARGQHVATRLLVVAHKPENAARPVPVRLAAKVVAKKPAPTRMHLASASVAEGSRAEGSRRDQAAHRKPGTARHSAHARKLI